MTLPRFLPVCAILLSSAGYASDPAPQPSLSASAPYQEYVLPVAQKAAHVAAITVIKQMGFEFPVAGAQNFPAVGDVDQWQRFQFGGMGRFTTTGPLEGTIVAVRVDDPHYDSAPQSSTLSANRALGGGRPSHIDSVFQKDPHPGFYHAAMLRADFSDEPNGGGTKVQVWITNATLDVNPLSGGNFGAATAQLNIPSHDSFLYGQFITKLAKALKVPKPVGIAPGGAGP